MESSGRRARPKSPFPRRKRVDELLSEIGQVALDDTPIRYNNKTRQGLIKSVLEPESGVELVLEQQYQPVPQEEALPHLLEGPPTPVHTNVLKDKLQPPHSDNLTLLIGSNSFETPPFPSLAYSEGMDAGGASFETPSPSLVYLGSMDASSTNSNSRHNRINKRALSRKKFMKQPETINEMGNNTCATQQEEPKNGSIGPSRSCIDMRTLLCQKFKPDRDEYEEYTYDSLSFVRYEGFDRPTLVRKNKAQRRSSLTQKERGRFGFSRLPESAPTGVPQTLRHVGKLDGDDYDNDEHGNRTDNNVRRTGNCQRTRYLAGRCGQKKTEGQHQPQLRSQHFFLDETEDDDELDYSDDEGSEWSLRKIGSVEVLAPSE